MDSEHSSKANHPKLVGSSVATVVESIKRHPLLTLGAFIVATVGAISTASNYVQRAANFYETRLTNKAEYDALREIDIRIGIDRVREVLGTPTVVHSVGWRNYREAIYTRDLYSLQVIYDSTGVVLFYGVLSQDPSFTPDIPDTSRKLGSHTYSEIMGAETAVYVFPGASNGRYIERSGSSRVNDFRLLYLAYLIPQGAEYDGREVQFGGLAALVDSVKEDVEQKDGNLGVRYARAVASHRSAWNAFRSRYRPNSYGVADGAVFWAQDGIVALDSAFQHTTFGAGQRAIYGPPGRRYH